MHSQMLTSRFGAELISYKLDGIEKIHQGQDCIDENGRVYWKRHFPVLFPIVGKLKQNKTIINGRTYEMGQHGFARDMDFEEISKTETKHHYMLKYNEETLKKYLLLNKFYYLVKYFLHFLYLLIHLLILEILFHLPVLEKQFHIHHYYNHN